jgi:uncharacterized protein (DUF488 family)
VEAVPFGRADLRPAVIFTIGHSTHTIEAFVELLRAHSVAQVADVRRVPKSQRHPQFEKGTLDAGLAARGIVYRHFPELGGMRSPRPDSVNTALREDSFRGYADHMQTQAFRNAVMDLLQFSGVVRTALMCAEAVWWHCHRKLLSDFLLVRNVQVRHILSTADAKPHELSGFARESEGGVIYPGLL